MSFDVAYIFGLLVVTIALFVTEALSFDLVALLVLIALIVGDIIEVEQALSGLSNEATITIGALFIISEALKRTGALDYVSDLLVHLAERGAKWLRPGLLIGSGTLSAFMNNTAVVAILLPVVNEVGKVGDRPASKLLMPLSFISIFGGVCTLIGTSTNLLVSSVMQDNGLEPLSMFELTPVGAILFVVGFAYLMTLSDWLLPDQDAEESLTERFDVQDYVTDLRLEADNFELGEAPEDISSFEDRDIELVDVLREGQARRRSDPSTRMEVGDVVRVQGRPQAIRELLDEVEGWSSQMLADLEDADLELGEDMLVEAVLSPDAALAGQRLEEVSLIERFDAVPLAVRELRGSDAEEAPLGEHTLRGGDTLLLKINRARLEDLCADANFIVVSELEEPSTREGKLPIAVAVLLGVVGVAAVGFLPIVATALIGVWVLMATRCLNPDEAYQAVNWKIIFLLAGLIPLGQAMEETGAAAMLADWTLGLTGGFGIWGLVAGMFGLTMLLTNVVSNAAAAVLMAPLAINTASAAGVGPRPLLIAVTFGASLSFMTPIGYQTNTMVYGSGDYSFTDFLRAGTPLNLLTWALVVVLVPLFWPG